jgi:hypothetical protein
VRTSEFATGFDACRGIKFDPDGFLYFSEAGHGGNMSRPGSASKRSHRAR